MIRRQRPPWSLTIILLSVLLRRDGASATATPTATVTAPAPPLVQEHYFQATVDHFNFRPTTEPTFPLRYLVNDQFWQRNGSGPCFFYAGNEANIWQFVNNSGFLFEAAQELHALVVFAEHRYYGTSKPFGSAYALGAPYNISFLTVEQAMADFSTLAVHIREKWDMSPQAAFIAFGGSYGANLALWLRLKNPNLWAGAIASSATPLKHVLRETNGFAKIETEAYANVSARCPDLVRSGWRELYTAAATKSGRTLAASMLGLCHPLPDPSAADDVHGWISSALETMVQYGYPYPTSFYNPVPAYPFKVACEGMLSAETGLEALRAAIDVYYNFTGQAGVCYDFGGLVLPEAARHWRRKGQHDRLSHQRIRHGDRNNIRDDEEDTEKAWGYQTCTEVYQPMPTDGITDFEVPFTPDQISYYADCWTRFGVQPRPNWEEMHFMGAHIAAGSNIFLTSGQLDPWRAAGIQSLPPKKGSQSESIVVRIIENGAHHLDLQASNEMDPPSVVAVREEQKAFIRRWILEWEEDSGQGIESEGHNPGVLEQQEDLSYY